MTEMVDISGNAKLFVHGDVATVLKGEVDPGHTPQMDLKQIPFALGAGRYTDPTFFGESCILNHRAWGTYLSSTGELLTEKKEGILDTPFLLGIEILQEPRALKTVQDLSALEIFSELTREFPLGFAFVADARFGLFEGSYLKRSPVYHEEINLHPTRYWEHCPPLEDVQAFLFGVVLTEAGKKQFPQSERAFYQNPGERKKDHPTSHMVSHTHAALCAQHPLPTDYEKLNELCLHTSFLGVRHFQAQSVIKEGNFALFDLIV